MSYATIIPTQNRPELLARALRSVYAQTTPATEIIVIDDASETPLVLPEKLCDSRTRVIHIKKAAGGAAARNVGLANATCPYVAFLDDDDEWLPSKMEKQLLYLQSNPESVLVSCGHVRIEGGNEYRETFTQEFVNRYRRYDNFFGSFSFLVIRHGNHRLDPLLPSLQDWDFALRVTQGAPFGVLDEALVNYYGHDQPRITTRPMNRLRGMRRCYMKHRETFSEDERRWWLSQIIFERSINVVDRKQRMARVAKSISLAGACQLPWKVKLRSMARKATSLVADKRTLVGIRSSCLSKWQTLQRGVGSPRTRSASSRSPRVLMISGRADFGGGPEHVYQLSKAVGSRASIYVACPREEPYWTRFMQLLGADSLREIPHRRFSAGALLGLARFIRDEQVEIIHAHGRAAGIYGRLAALLTGRRCCYTPHGGTPVQSPKTLCYAAIEWLLSVVTSKIIAVSATEGDALRSLCSRPAQLEVIPNGVDIPARATARIDRGDAPTRVLHATRFVYQKNSLLLVNILDSLRQSGDLNAFQFVVLGNRPAALILSEN